MHCVGLKSALGVSVQTATNQLDAEVHALPTAIMANLRTQEQLTRFHLIERGQRILKEVEERPRSGAASRLRAHRELAEALRDISHLDWSQSPP